jgi:hypothetical protein
MFLEIAEYLEQAGLPSLAAQVYRKRQRREWRNDRWRGSIDSAEAGAEEHLARVRAASAR